MAEAVREDTLSNNLSSARHLVKLECAVCLQTCIHPAELPCGHIFCYLCIKGIVNQGRRCAMCRQDIPVDYLDKPRLLNPVDAEITSQGYEDGHLWFYEGHNGWWQYDERTSLELESAYQKGERCCDLLIAGFLYTADFDGMLQYRRNDPSRRRRIKRDLATTTKKGIAGLKPTKNCDLTSLNSLEVASNDGIQNLPDSNSTPLNTINGIRIFNSALNNSSRYSDRAQCLQRLGGVPSNCRSVALTNSNADSQNENSLGSSSTVNFNNTVCDTLDWTIEQIESLNLELLNDYEALFRDVNIYSHLQGSLNQGRLRSSSNFMSGYLNRRHSLRESSEINVESIDTSPDFSISSSNENNDLFPRSASILSNETELNNSAVIETQTDGLALQSNAEIPQPPSRNRRICRLRGDTEMHSSNLRSDSLLQRFISKK